MEPSGIEYMTSGKRWVIHNHVPYDKNHGHMRIIETVYEVKDGERKYEVKMTHVKGLKVRELVKVGKVTAQATKEPLCSSENTFTR